MDWHLIYSLVGSTIIGLLPLVIVRVLDYWENNPYLETFTNKE